MGVIINNVCCINIHNMTENEYENCPTHHKNNQAKETYKRISNFGIDKYYDSSLQKSLPQNEIKFINKKNPPTIEVDSLSKLPISTKNVIRKYSANPLDDYDVIKNLGKGTFGHVYKVMHKKTGNIRAMKVIPKNKLKHGFTDEDITQEINILTTLEHPHIIKLFEFYTFKKNYYLINEFCTDGDLSEKLYEIKMFPEFFVKILMIQIFNAVLYLNKKNVIHGDLKLENIMVDSCLNEDEITEKNGKKHNFIQSILEDEKEINEFIRKTTLKRANTYHNFGNKNFNANSKLSSRKIKEDYMNLKDGQSQDKLVKVQMRRGNTIIKSSIFRQKRKTYVDFENEETNPPNGITKNKKSAFSYLNGEEDDEEENENENNHKSDEDNDHDIENDNKKMNNIKVYNENFIKNQLEKEKAIKREKKITKFIIHQDSDNSSLKGDQNNNSQIKRSLTLNTMKMKNYELKLIDFGCAKIFSKYKKNFEDTIGTLLYCSPEVLKNYYSKECDVWSCGVIMYVLLSGHFPFIGKTEDEITKKILSGKFTFNKKYFSNVSDKAKDLIKKCLVYNKNKRITAEEALKHEFFADDINPHNIFEDEIDSKNVLISLKNFSQQTKIYQTVLTYLSHNYTDKEELNRLKKIFYKIDLNLDGKLSRDELKYAFKEAGVEMKSEQLNRVIKSIDFDGNGFIEYEEFIRVTLPKERLFTEKNLKIAFDMFDLDKNGTISLNEFKQILGVEKIKDKNVNKELLKEIPIKGNEEMTFEQFKKIFLDN